MKQYRRASVGYDQHMRRFARWQRAAVERLQLQGAETVIDVACGTGLNFPLLEEGIGPEGRIIGIDLSPEMVSQARARVADKGWKNVRLIEGAVEDAEFEGFADAALFSFTHDVLQSPAAVANVVAHLRPGARVASVGAKLAGRWNLPVNFFVRRAARPYMTTFQGLDRPWRLLEPYAAEMHHESLALGGAYIAWGLIAEKAVDDPPAIEELPPPHDDGATAHLPGRQLPAIELPSTDGGRVALNDLVARTVVFVHPSIGGIDDALLGEWTAIPGARGCTAEACGFRDQLGSFRSARVDVLGVSGQPAGQQHDAVERLRLPYPLLSDERLHLADSLGLPVFEFHGRRYFKRVTLVISEGRVEAALYPVFPPDQAAEQALAWLAENPPR